MSKKKNTKLEKILLWFVLWSAVYWAVKINKKFKENQDKKKSIWHNLNKIFFKK